MTHYYEMYRYQYVSGELEFGKKPMPKHGMALETVMREDFDHVEELRFASSKGNAHTISGVLCAQETSAQELLGNIR